MLKLCHEETCLCQFGSGLMQIDMCATAQSDLGSLIICLSAKHKLDFLAHEWGGQVPTRACVKLGFPR